MWVAMARGPSVARVGEWTRDTLSVIDKFHEGEWAKVMPGEF